jgi:hypothetical protein
MADDKTVASLNERSEDRRAEQKRESILLELKNFTGTETEKILRIIELMFFDSVDRPSRGRQGVPLHGLSFARSFGKLRT